MDDLSNLIGLALDEYKSRQHVMLQNFRKELVCQVLSCLEEEKIIEHDKIDELHRTIMKQCVDIKFDGNIIENDEVEEVEEEIEEVVEKKKRPVTPYQYFKYKWKVKLKDEKIPQKELNQKIRDKWNKFKQNKEKVKKLKIKSDKLDKLPKDPLKVTGLQKKVKTFFYKKEKLAYVEKNPSATRKELKKYLDDLWNNIKEDKEKFQEQVELMNKKLKKNKIKFDDDIEVHEYVPMTPEYSEVSDDDWD